jgi:bacterioferritin (cytochrome b1)
MTEKEFLRLMNDDLKREYQHMLFYLHSSALITGLNRHELSEFLFEEAQSELKHVREFTDQIIAHGGTPLLATQLTDTLPNYFTGDPGSILSFVLQMEQDVVNIFAERLKQTEEIASPFGQLLHIFYEDQIVDSHKTVHEVKMLLRRT